MVSEQNKQTTQAGKPEEDWETLRNPFLHKALGPGLYSGRLCAHSVCAYADLALDMDIHYLRFPGAIKPAVQLNNGLFLLCFLWNSLVLVCMGACVSVLERGRPSPPYGVTHGSGPTLPCPVAGF